MVFIQVKHYTNANENNFCRYTAITCLIRPPVENGRAECSDGNAFGSICEVLCDRRYELEGEEQSQCLDDDGDQLGTWSALLPSCKGKYTNNL